VNVGVPLLLLVLYAVCFGLYTFRRDSKIGVYNAETFTLRKVTLEMTQLQGSLDYLLRDGKLGAAREMLAGMSSNPYLQVGLLVDEQQKVLASTRLALFGQEVSQAWPELARPEHTERLAQARQQMRGIVEVSADRQRIVGYYPVFLSFGKPPRSVGYLYFQHDLTAIKAASLREVERSVLRSSVMLVLIAGAMGLFVQFTLGRRIQRLVLAAQQVLGRRQDTPRDEAGGEDALGELGQAVHQMAEQIGHSRRQIAQNEERFQTLIERSPDAIFIHREGTLVFNNPAAAVMLGYEREASLKGRPLSELLVSEDVLALSENSEEGTPRELQWLHRTGRLVLGEVVTVRLEFEGEPARVSIVRDITERKHLQEKLNAADRMASLGTLAAGVAHEINNPLSFMLSNARFIRDELQELSQGREGPEHERWKEVQEALDELLSGGDRVSEIVLDLKKFSRRDEGRRGQVDLHSVLDLCGNIAKSQLRHRARLVKDYGELPSVLGSESRLGQLFLNLIINAAQAIPEDGNAERHEVRITTRREAGDWVVVAVRDTGVGIPREHLGRLFDPFFTTKPVGVGTGLGLSICHGIVTGLGGRITVDSEPGQGSTFRVFLPLGEAAQGDEKGAGP
jgi:PAS domain S-box-containing protein